MSERGTVILLRHAQSLWNVDRRFTGWGDPALTARGQDEARAAGQALAAQGVRFHRAYCSMLRRTQQTLDLVLRELEQTVCPVVADWRLNERHYGALEGCDRVSATMRYRQDQLALWRSDCTARPPALDLDDPRHPRLDARYAGVAVDRLPCSESLADAQRRAVEFWRETAQPRLVGGENLLIVSHNNTLRTLVCHLEGRPLAGIEAITWPTARALAYRVNGVGKVERAPFEQ